MINVKLVKNQPFLSPDPELEVNDLAAVSEKDNHIRFILDDDSWEKTKDGYIFKLRLKEATDLYTKVKELGVKLDQNHENILANICKVYKTTTSNEEAKPQLEESLYNSALKEIEEAISEFNTHSLMKGAK